MKKPLPILLALYLPLGAMFHTGCQKEPSTSPSAAGSEHATTPTPAKGSDASNVMPTSPPTPPKPPVPKRPEPSWAIFREAYDEKADVELHTKWSGENRLEIETQNIHRLTLDLTKLPEGAPDSGPWILRIDRQGIQITGARGRILDLVRSPNGDWVVDKDK